VLLLHADPDAYKAPGELAYMPYLDAGVMVGAMYLAATAHGLRCCYINPNIREHNRPHFETVFGPGIYCGGSRGRLAPRVGDRWTSSTSSAPAPTTTSCAGRCAASRRICRTTGCGWSAADPHGCEAWNT
jgi:Nitroreductase family.